MNSLKGTEPQQNIKIDENRTCMGASTPQGPPSLCTKPRDVSKSELNLRRRISKLDENQGRPIGAAYYFYPCLKLFENNRKSYCDIFNLCVSHSQERWKIAPRNESTKSYHKLESNLTRHMEGRIPTSKFESKQSLSKWRFIYISPQLNRNQELLCNILVLL